MELPPYLRLDQDDSEAHSQSPGPNPRASPSPSVTSNPLHAAASTGGAGEAYVLRVLFKESKVEITTLRPNSTILGTST